MYHVILLLQRYVKEHAYQTIVVLSTHIQVLFVPSWKESTTEMQAFPVNHLRLHCTTKRWEPSLTWYVSHWLHLILASLPSLSGLVNLKRKQNQLAILACRKVQSGWSLSKMHSASWVLSVSLIWMSIHYRFPHKSLQWTGIMSLFLISLYNYTPGMREGNHDLSQTRIKPHHLSPESDTVPVIIRPLEYPMSSQRGKNYYWNDIHINPVIYISWSNTMVLPSQALYKWFGNKAFIMMAAFWYWLTIFFWKGWERKSDHSCQQRNHPTGWCLEKLCLLKLSIICHPQSFLTFSILIFWFHLCY